MAAVARIAVIGKCASAGCDRPARVHIEVVVGDRVVRGPVCERCERTTRLGAVLYGEQRRPA
ncbi:MAG TPA: hypothetical protein VFA83_07950 [Acidimicrobiales bacterium]|nr:hypothetical protein [Acidimicrobiales bacterium]